MNINEFRKKINAVKWFKKDNDYHEFDELVSSITGKEDIEWLDCLLDSICVEDDYGPYENLYNAIWRFPPDIVGKRLAEYLAILSCRMNRAPFQVWRFYIPVPQQKTSTTAFLNAALQWNRDDLGIGLSAIEKWCLQSARDEEAWSDICQKLGGQLPESVTIDSVPDTYEWSDSMKERLEVWRGLPPGKTNEKVFWFGGHSTHFEEWQSDLPHVVEALALRHGKKWRDIVVWLNPLSFYAKVLYPEFIEALAKSPEDVRNRALANIKKARKHTYDDLCKNLKKEGIIPSEAVWSEI